MLSKISSKKKKKIVEVFVIVVMIISKSVIQLKSCAICFISFTMKLFYNWLENQQNFTKESVKKLIILLCDVKTEKVFTE